MRKRLTWLIIAGLATCMSVIIGTRHGKGEANSQASTQRKMVKVLRRKDDVKFKPTKDEIAHGQDKNELSERKLENTIPSHVPIKIKMRKEKEALFKDLKNEKWARDFELQITNSGNKPIYEFYLLLILPEIKTRGGLKVAFPIVFGRGELADPNSRPTSEDVPIQPGETKVFTIDPRQVPVWEKLQREDHRPQPTKIQLKLEGVSFGDGTAFVGNDGVAIPRLISNICPNGIGDEGTKEGVAKWSSGLDPSGNSNHSLFAHAPASFSPVFFSAALLGRTTVSVPPQNCCPESCTSLKRHNVYVCYNCTPQNRPSNVLCSDPTGTCNRTEYSGIECQLGNGETFECQTIDMIPCDTAPPTSTPTPTPSPSPVPTSSSSPTPQDCAVADRPNASNCVCQSLPGAGPTWVCNCLAGQPADYRIFPNSGGCDPATTVNNGNNCCVCIDQSNCDPGFFRNFNCECTPNPTPTPTPGGGYYSANCIEYFWVLYECYPVGETSWSCEEVDRWYAGCF